MTSASGIRSTWRMSARAAGVELPVHICRRDPAAPQRAHLILHQGNERRDHERESGAEQRGHLIAERLAGTRGQDSEDIPTREQRAEHFELVYAETGVTEPFAEDCARGVEPAEPAEPAEPPESHEAGRHVARNSIARCGPLPPKRGSGHVYAS